MSVGFVTATVMLWTSPVAEGLYCVLEKPQVLIRLSMSIHTDVVISKGKFRGSWWM